MLVLAVLLILPGFQRMKTRADQITCLDRMHHLGFATMKFAADHEGRYPVVSSDPFPYSDQPDVFLGDRFSDYLRGPIAPYLRCPKLKAGKPGSGQGSNGVLDYSFVAGYSGGSKDAVERKSEYLDARGNPVEEIITPLIVEEHPETMNAGEIRATFEPEDAFGDWHDGAMNYIAYDGSGRTVEWQVRPRGKDVREKPAASE